MTFMATALVVYRKAAEPKLPSGRMLYLVFFAIAAGFQAFLSWSFFLNPMAISVLVKDESAATILGMLQAASYSGALPAPWIGLGRRKRGSLASRPCWPVAYCGRGRRGKERASSRR